MPTPPTPQAETAQIGFSAKEIVNPGRGQYRWGGLTKWGDNDGEYFPNSSPSLYDPATFWPGGSGSYYRFNWRQLEPAEGSYDFSAIDRKLSAAASRGQRLGFRVMVVDSCCSPRTGDGRAQIFPDWLTSRVNAWTWSSGGDAAVIPDWNDPDYLSAVERLINALGQRYDGDDRVAYFDMMGYGNYGEWHLWPWEGTNGPRGQAPITCIGDASGGWAWPRMLDVPATMQRWRTAPLVTEWCGSNYTPRRDLEGDQRYSFMLVDVGRDLYAVGRGQVMRWHLSLMSSGNFPHAYNGQKMSGQQFTDWSMANKTAGYRYSAALHSAPATVGRGQSLPIATTWSNAGVAPTYESWSPALEIRPRGQTYAVAWADSIIDLNTLCAESTPAGSAVPAVASRTVMDTLQIPANVAPGGYDIVVVVWNRPQKPNPTATMPETFYGPIRLAQDGRMSDGHFKIGEITIN